MKVLVSVGTTSFDSLVSMIDRGCYEEKYEFIFQIAGGSYKPLNYPHFDFDSDIWDKYDKYKYIVHCGAGTVYRLLESEKIFIAVPNFDRVDSHQLDLASYLDENSLALVAKSMSELDSLLRSNALNDFSPKPYVKNQFFKGKELTRYVRGYLSD